MKEKQTENRRTIQFPEQNFRAVTEEVEGQSVRKIRGYALLFDVEGTPWLGSPWREKIDKNALADTVLAGTYGLLNHNSNWVLGRAGKNMTLTVDKLGLYVEIELGSTWLDDYVFDRVSRELIDGMSFWFDSKSVVTTDWEKKTETIVKINEIYEVSLVPFPAYPQTVAIAQETDPEPTDPKAEQELIDAQLDFEMEV